MKNKPIVMKGLNGSITLNNDSVIVKKGALFGHCTTTYLIQDIIGINYKKHGITTGYIELVTPIDKNDHLDFTQQPNVVLLKLSHKKRTLAFKEMLENAISEVKRSRQGSQQAVLSVADEISKFKQLFDEGAITEEEYVEKKKQLLNL
ncbi:SHOCT domain-containing protein [Christensenella timonensis]|uniref:SHOCT domain-containing protein n=1 Tax=Christensenella timonensis TaxID=1816678 RepID=UPI00082DCDCC|nr:SHOCT domain-containing protein [Christensenella timonensis]